MKHIRNLWNLLKQEISLWKYEKQELVKGICYIVMIAWLFFDRIAFCDSFDSIFVCFYETTKNS